MSTSIARAQAASKVSAKTRNDRKWDNKKAIIWNLYITEDHTLKETMDIVHRHCQFVASERKWKDKLREWHFEKNVSTAIMRILIAKSEDRKRLYGKETEFLHHDVKIPTKRLEDCQKKMTTATLSSISPAPDTPAGFTYCTPRPVTPVAEVAPVYIDDDPIQDELSLNCFSSASQIVQSPQNCPESQALQGNSVSLADTLADINMSNTTDDERIARSVERHLLIHNIARKSMLWNCPGDGLHTVDEETLARVYGVETLLPFNLKQLINTELEFARVEKSESRTKSAAARYLGIVILAMERKCYSHYGLLQYVDEFLDFLELRSGACVSELRRKSPRPVFLMSQRSDVFFLYHEILTLLRQNFDETSEVVARICILLADLETLYPETSSHAPTLYGVAIEAYYDLGCFDKKLDCQLSLAIALLDLNRSSDAYELLGRCCSVYLRDHLHHGAQDLSHWHLDSLSPVMSDIRSSVFRLKDILSSMIGNSKQNHNKADLYLSMLHEIAALGGYLSIEASQGHHVYNLEALDPLWSELFSKLLCLDDARFATLKAFVYLQSSHYICNGFNLFRNAVFLNDIIIAYHYLCNDGRFPARFKSEFIQHVYTIDLEARRLPHLESLDMMDCLSLSGIAGMLEDAGERVCEAYYAVDMGSAWSSMPDVGLRAFDETADFLMNEEMREKYGVVYSDIHMKGLLFTD